MLRIADSFEFNGLLCFQKRLAENSYYFLPLHADVDRTEGGHPMVNLITFGSNGYLMLTAVWQAPVQGLEELRAEIARRNEISDPSTIQLSLAPVQVAGCDLLLGDGSGQFKAIAKSATSGMPPYASLFSVILAEQEMAVAAAAINGNIGQVVAEYDISVATELIASAKLVPLSSEFAPWLRNYLDSGPIGFRAAIQEAIEEGLATILLNIPEQPSEQTISALYDRVLTEAASLLPGLIDSGDADTTTDLQVTVSLLEETRQPFHPQVDLAVVNFPPHQIQVASSSTGADDQTNEKYKESAATPVSVNLGFDPRDTPLGWVRLQRGNSQGILKPPQFASITLPSVPTSQPIRLTAGFTDGTQAYKKVLDQSDEKNIILQPRDLGLTMLVIDGRALAEAGARSAQIWLRYKPPHLLGEQRHSIQLGEASWVKHLWLTTPTKTSLRHLDYHWQVVRADGRISSGAALYNGSSEIILSLSGEKTNVTN